MSSWVIGQVLFNGLTIGSIYVLVSLGFNMVFGVMRIINFAHGELYMIGAFITFLLYGFLKINYLLTLVVSAFAVGLFGVLLERTLFRRVRHEELNSMILSLGIALIIQNVFSLVFGPQDLSIPTAYTGIISLGFFSYPVERLIMVLFSFIIISFVYIFIKFTRYGNAIRAVVQDLEAAAIQGIHINRVYSLSFGISASLAAIAGGLLGPIFSISPFMGSFALIKAFIVVILGGLGSFGGAVVGGLLLGFHDSIVSTFVGGAANDMMGFLIIILIILFRPSGLLGRRQ